MGGFGHMPPVANPTNPFNVTPGFGISNSPVSAVAPQQSDMFGAADLDFLTKPDTSLSTSASFTEPGPVFNESAFEAKAEVATGFLEQVGNDCGRFLISRLTN
jgi:hypothetical protein